MIIIFYIFLAMCLIGAGFCTFFIIRNDRVCSFRLKIIDMIFDSKNVNQKLEIYNKVSYNYMLYKFWKSLKLESFYSKEDCEILTNKQ